MAVPSVPTPDTLLVFADLTNARVIQNSDFSVSPPSSLILDGSQNGFSSYGAGVLPSSLTTPFIRMRIMFEAHPGDIGDGEVTRIGAITNYNPVTETGNYYGLEFTELLAVRSIKFSSGTFSTDGPNIILTENDSNTEVDDAVWMVEDFAYMDIHIGAVNATIYLYNLAGTLKYQKTLALQEGPLGTVGVYLWDSTLGVSKPHIDNFFVNDKSPY